MTDDIALLADRRDALQRISYPIGSRHKSFARSVAGKAPHELSPKQRAHIARLAWRYCKQMPAHLVPSGNPDTEPQRPAPRPAPPRPIRTASAPPDLLDPRLA